MDNNVDMQAAMRQYLLGEMDENLRGTLEERLMIDEPFNDELSAAEDELIDAYLDDELNVAERESFESFYLSTPERMRKLSFARTFNRYVSDAQIAESDAETDAKTDETVTTTESVAQHVPGRSPSPLAWLMQHRALGAALAAVLLLAVSFGIYRAFDGGQRSALEREIAELNRADGARPDGAPDLSVVVALSPGLTRASGGVQSVNVMAGVPIVKLQLLLDAGEYESFRATLLSANGDEVFTVGGLKASDENGVRIVPLNIPARALERGDYRLKLSGRTREGVYEDIGSYYLHVVK
jgi:hypothetical protein